MPSLIPALLCPSSDTPLRSGIVFCASSQDKNNLWQRPNAVKTNRPFHPLLPVCARSNPRVNQQTANTDQTQPCGRSGGAPPGGPPSGEPSARRRISARPNHRSHRPGALAGEGAGSLCEKTRLEGDFDAASGTVVNQLHSSKKVTAKKNDIWLESGAEIAGSGKRHSHGRERRARKKDLDRIAIALFRSARMAHGDDTGWRQSQLLTHGFIYRGNGSPRVNQRQPCDSFGWLLTLGD